MRPNIQTVLPCLAGLLLLLCAPAWGAGGKESKEERRSPSLLAMPIASNGSTLDLQCGRTYGGTLDLRGKVGVRVRTVGNCGKAAITPGRPVTGWSQYQGQIWSAPLRFTPQQVAVDDVPLALAHFPNLPQTWAEGKSSNPSSIEFPLPNRDLAGATVVYRPEEWMIEVRPILAYEDGAIRLAPKRGDAFDPPSKVSFYVEGKLWMLDSPGEWVASGDRLYVWTPDGKSPEGRVWAAPALPGIDASESRQVSIDGVKIYSALVGIDGSNSTDLQISNSEIRNSAQDGIFAGGSGLRVDNVNVSNSVQNGIYGYYGITDSVVANSTITDSGMIGMPKRSKGGIVFEDASGQRILNNKVLRSSYIGIRVHRNAVVSNNVVEGACLILSDCGGIYTFAPDRQALNVRIDGNTVKNLGRHRYAYGIYLDDHASGVIVSKNILAGNPGGMELHNASRNDITQNVFSGSIHEHILFNDTDRGGNIRQNRIEGNTFIAERGAPTFRLWSTRDETVRGFGEFDVNNYSAPQEGFAEVAGMGMLSFGNWQSRMQQDRQSSFKPMSPPPRTKRM